PLFRSRFVIGFREFGATFDQGETHARDPRRQLLAGRRTAGLNDDGMALRTALDVERPLDRIEPAFVIQPPNLALVEEPAGPLVGDNRAVFPGIPKTAHDIDEFVCDLVPEVMLLDAILIEI